MTSFFINIFIQTIFETYDNWLKMVSNCYLYTWYFKNPHKK